jgi:hypothetical protein
LPFLHRLFQACYLKRAITCKDDIKSVTDEWMGMVCWLSDADRGKLKYLEENLCLCHFVHWPGI